LKKTTYVTPKIVGSSLQKKGNTRKKAMGEAKNHAFNTPVPLNYF